jgi:hypothetical protein
MSDLCEELNEIFPSTPFAVLVAEDGETMYVHRLSLL